MEVSNDLMREIGKVLRKYIDRTTRDKVIEELQDVPGNKTFRDAVERLAQELLNPL